MSRTSLASRGQMLVLTALAMVVILGAAALAVDYGLFLSVRRDLQGVSDAAALAASAQLGAPEDTPPTLAQETSGAVDALVYLNDHLGWGHDRAWAVVNASLALQKTAPLVVDTGTRKYCVWVWTPTPTAAVTTSGSAPCQNNAGGLLYSPANYPGSTRKAFVRVDTHRDTSFARILGIGESSIGVLAVAGPQHANYAVMALKPDFGPSPNDSNYGIKVGGNSQLNIGRGDIGGNYSLAWAGSGAVINFTPGTEQALYVSEPLVVQGSGSVAGGGSPGIQQLSDPLEDPAYGVPPTCTVGLTTPCWTDWPPSTGGATGHGVYPACSSPADINNHTIDCADPGPMTIWPGAYERVNIPNGTVATLSTTCYSTDVSCMSNNRPGVFYFRLDQRNSGGGLYVGGTPGSPTTVSGCGVLLIFDPDETGGSGVQMNIGGSGSSVSINGCPSMRSDPTNPTGTTNYLWYGYGAADYTNPLSLWVRPNRKGYNVTSSSGGSNVITMGSGSSINENGVIYAPEDNTGVAGGGAGSGVGQIVSWTITYQGNSIISEAFQGPAKLITRLLQ